MRNDLEIINVTFPKSQNILRVYALGDLHVGAPNYDEEAVKKKIQIIADDQYSCVVLCGDLADYGLKNSKTNTYLATMQPKEQQEYVYELILPIKDKIAGAVSGNHEERITKEVGLCPLYDLCVRWGQEDKYRENVAITKYSFGTTGTGKTQQNIFIGLTTHGSTRNKHRKFTGGFDGIDFEISAHTHQSEYSPAGRIRVDRTSGNIRHVPFKQLVVDANLEVGSYGLKKEYDVPPPPELQYLELSTVRATTKDRTLHRVMNYHSIQI